MEGEGEEGEEEDEGEEKKIDKPVGTCITKGTLNY